MSGLSLLKALTLFLSLQSSRHHGKFYVALRAAAALMRSGSLPPAIERLATATGADRSGRPMPIHGDSERDALYRTVFSVAVRPFSQHFKSILRDGDHVLPLSGQGVILCNDGPAIG